MFRLQHSMRFVCRQLFSPGRYRPTEWLQQYGFPSFQCAINRVQVAKALPPLALYAPQTTIQQMASLQQTVAASVTCLALAVLRALPAARLVHSGTLAQVLPMAATVCPDPNPGCDQSCNGCSGNIVSCLACSSNYFPTDG